jgi:hypothetical protein
VKTQGQYQVLGDFLGLIFSVFDKGRLEVCCFQSRQNVNGDWERVEIPLFVSSSSKIPATLDAVKVDGRLLEGLVSLQVVLLNEEREAFELRNPPAALIRGANVPRPSDLELLRQSSVYQSAIFRLVDLQIYPLLQAMKSKIASLQQERAELLRKLEDASSSSGRVSPRAGAMAKDDDLVIVRDNVDSADNALKALLTMVPKWQQSCRAIQIAFQGFKSRVIASSNVSSYALGSEGSAKVQRALVSSMHGGLTTRSPWLLTFGTTSAPLLAVNASVEEGCVDFTLAGGFSAAGAAGATAPSTVSLTLKLEGVDKTLTAETTAVLGTALHRALRLHQWGA